MTARLSLLSLALVALLAPPLPAADVPIGSKVGNLTFTDIRYTLRSLDDLGKPKAAVVVFTAAGCPLVPRYLPVLDKLERDYRDKGVQFLAVNVGPEDTVVEMAAQMLDHGVAFPVVKDFDGKAADAFGATRTPEVVVLDADRVIRYRGRIDDRHRPGVGERVPTRHDLKEALDEVLAGNKVTVTETAVEGCKITPPSRPKPEKPVTYAGQVAAVIHKHCGECHRAGAEAPFALGTYEQTRGKAKMIAEVIREGRMPPWFADPAHGTFANKRGLSPRERDLVLDWIDGGTLPGDLATAPPAPAAKTGKWRIGEPDLVVKTTDYDLPATGDIPYAYAVLPHVFEKETWVEAIEILPEDRKLVHHANLAHVSLGGGFSAGNFITGYVPGGDPMTLGDGVAFRLPAGAMLVLQIHFVAGGKPANTHVAVGVKYAKGTVQQELRHLRLADTRYRIPAGDPAHAVPTSRVLPHDAVMVGMFSHMHLRGKAMTFKAHTPDGKTQTLLSIPNYRFDWQLAYRPEPGKLKLPKGTRLEVVGVFDNSAFNPFNPDPKAVVRDGQQTYQEMVNGFFFYLQEGEKLGLEVGDKGVTKR